MCFTDDISGDGCHNLEWRGIKGELDTTKTSLKLSYLGCLSLQSRLLSKYFLPYKTGRKI